MSVAAVHVFPELKRIIQAEYLFDEASFIRNLVVLYQKGIDVLEPFKAFRSIGFVAQLTHQLFP